MLSSQVLKIENANYIYMVYDWRWKNLEAERLGSGGLWGPGVWRWDGEESSTGFSNWIDIGYWEEEYIQGLAESRIPGKIVLAVNLELQKMIDFFETYWDYNSSGTSTWRCTLDHWRQGARAEPQGWLILCLPGLPSTILPCPMAESSHCHVMAAGSNQGPNWNQSHLARESSFLLFSN